ncbi:GNAT family N-acetyltransferase [Methanogenium organophilum]|uniref:GNAT family N-acetyltransferase n=1 Tax=Methanogenium organophilum TaxID=2199 RepID=A0A9X9S4A4_METOG|nr:GNAT family N-acetyltransferase [Methanogenium organophilum]WAI01684.1 GNAT family N-acetyltransferase [Methanogenium organophilum]
MMRRGDGSGEKRLHIRIAVPLDGDIIAARNGEMAFETEGHVLDSDTARKGAMSVLEDPAKGWYLVAEHEGAIIGQCMITLEWSDWRNGQIWWIQSVYIIPECRRKGVFSEMYAWIDAEARRQPDVVGLRLYVEHENLAARGAYRMLGMEEAPYVMYEALFPECRGGK